MDANQALINAIRSEEDPGSSHAVRRILNALWQDHFAVVPITWVIWPEEDEDAPFDFDN